MSRTIAQHVLFQIFFFFVFFRFESLFFFFFFFFSFLFYFFFFFFFFRKGRLGESLSLPLQNYVKSPKFFWSGNRNPTAKATRTWQTWKDLIIMSRKIAQHAQNKIFYLSVVHLETLRLFLLYNWTSVIFLFFFFSCVSFCLFMSYFFHICFISRVIKLS